MAFTKGQPKTPGSGRRKKKRNEMTADIKAAFRLHGDECVKAIMKLTKSKDERVSLGALQTALDRGFGKAYQSMEVTGKDGGPMTLQVFHGVPARVALEELERPVQLQDKGNGVLEPKVK